jgi:hypothetical protein
MTLAATLLAAALAVPIAFAGDTSASSADLVREAKSLQVVCGKCHNLQVVMDTPRSLDEWRDTMQQMVDRGANGTDDQYDDILDYLHRTMTTIDVNSAGADDLAAVLNVSDETVKLIIERRSVKKFANRADLKSIPGVDAATVDSKSKLLYFQ